MGFFHWFSSTRFPEEPGWLRRWLVLSGRPRKDPKLERIKRAAEADVAAMQEEDREYFRQQGPDRRADD